MRGELVALGETELSERGIVEIVLLWKEAISACTLYVWGRVCKVGGLMIDIWGWLARAWVLIYLW